jgi:ferredoxin
VWAGGDVAFGPRNLIDAIADGRRAAGSIHAALTGAPPPVQQEVKIELIAKPTFRRLATGYDAIARVPVPSVARERRVGFAEVEVGYDAGHAVLEGMRCLRCFDNIMLRPELCILCGLCVDVCPFDCIAIVRADTAGVGDIGQSALVIDEKSCIRCGLCINRCPPSALVMVHAKEVAGE